jgi:hypothetical protein
MVVVGQDEDIEAIRSRMLAAVENSPPVGRSRVDSKAAMVRSLMDVIDAYRARYPQATRMDVLRFLNGHGADIKMDTLRKVLKESENATGKDIARKQKRTQTGTRKRKVTGPRNRTPISYQDPDLTTALVMTRILEDLPLAPENATPPESGQITKPPSPKSEWLTEEDMKDL